jgi:hypothetical protein
MLAGDVMSARRVVADEDRPEPDGFAGRPELGDSFAHLGQNGFGNRCTGHDHC